MNKFKRRLENALSAGAIWLSKQGFEPLCSASTTRWASALWSRLSLERARRERPLRFPQATTQVLT